MDTIERDPNGLDPKVGGAKLDAGKSPVRRGLLEYFPRACMAVADISGFGAAKYSWGGWQSVPDGISRYGDAEARHICLAVIQGEHDSDSKKLHAAHEAWNALARLEFILREQEAKSSEEPYAEGAEKCRGSTNGCMALRQGLDACGHECGLGKSRRKPDGFRYSYVTDERLTKFCTEHRRWMEDGQACSECLLKAASSR